jgi:predicted AlkP superfamily pyrophosphatase or phosphodiesterase
VKKHNLLWLVVAAVLAVHATAAVAAGKAEHVVVVVWDGMRPDFLTDAFAPTLARLAREGVVFANHHSIYPTSTEVNGVALATGAFPNRNGVIANREYRPAIDPLRRIAIEDANAIARGDAACEDQYLRLATVPELLRRAGRTVAVAGTKPVARLFDRFHRAEVKLPGAAKFESPNTKLDTATTRALIGELWSNGVPAYSLLWLSDPDTTQHATWPGSDQALAAIRSVDNCLASVLAELDARGVRAKTDVFVVSDHGFSTAMQTVNMAEALQRAGFAATREFKTPPQRGDVMVVGNGGTVLLYVIGREKKLTQQLVEFLQQQEYTGVILTRDPMPGTFTLEQARLNSPDAADIVVSFRWTDENNQAGVPGLFVTDGATYGLLPVGQGRGGHSTLSPYDVRNTLVAAGPDFAAGQTNQFPSSNTDLAPTILSVLNVKPPQPMDGRLLTRNPSDKPRRQTIEAANGRWRQYLKVTEFGGAFYVDEGNRLPPVVPSETKPASP